MWVVSGRAVRRRGGGRDWGRGVVLKRVEGNVCPQVGEGAQGNNYTGRHRIQG